MSNLASICEIAHGFYQGIRKMKIDGCEVPGWIERFPSNCCDHASHVLIYIYVQAGYQDILINYATIGDARHVWITVDGFDVDVTAYQFDGCDQRVICEVNSAWHSQLTDKESKTPGTEKEVAVDFSKRWIESFVGREWFDAIKDYIPCADWFRF